MQGWIAVTKLSDLKRARKTVVEVGGTQIALFWHDDRVFALQNICIHRQRELGKGVILKDRIVCPGHQWSFDLETGYEAKMRRYQPTFHVMIEDGAVFVDPTARSVEISTKDPASGSS